jgi:hypothetical protein
MGSVCQLSQEEEKLLVKYLDTMIIEGKIQPTSGTVASLLIFVPKRNGRGLPHCFNYRHLHDYTKQDETPLPIMKELSARLKGATHSTNV